MIIFPSYIELETKSRAVKRPARCHEASRRGRGLHTGSVSPASVHALTVSLLLSVWMHAAFEQEFGIFHKVG